MAVYRAYVSGLELRQRNPAIATLRHIAKAFEMTGGEGGIRTPDTVARMPHFECGAFNHSATSPEGRDRARGLWRSI